MILTARPLIAMLSSNASFTKYIKWTSMAVDLKVLCRKVEMTAELMTFSFYLSFLMKKFVYIPAVKTVI